MLARRIMAKGAALKNRFSSGVRRRTAVWTVLAMLLIAASTMTWHLWLAPTRVALVRYPDFQAARIVQARPGPFVRVDALGVGDLDQLRGYDLVLLFGRGLALNERQLAQLRAASAAGTPLYVDAPTNPRMDVTNLAGDDLDAVSGYLRNGGPANYAHLLNYARAVLDGKALFSQTPQPPAEMPKDVFFGKNDRAAFTDFDAFQAWQRQQPGWQAGRPRLALLTSVPGPFNANRDHVDATIRAFESAGFDVVPISAIEKRLAMLQTVDPAAVVYMPHGRLTLGQADEARQWLAARNIPLFAPVTIFEEASEWAADQRSFDGGLLAMSVTLPELDGAIAPVVIAAQARDERGFKVFRALPHRLDRFVSLVRRTVALRSMPNKDKKLAVYYYKGPGQSALHAGNLEVVPSLYAFLKHLKTQGYRIDGLPDTEQGFADLLQRRGPNIGPYAKGDFAEFTRTADPALVSAETLRQWCGSSVDQSLCDQAARQFGPAPGDYLRVGDRVTVARVPLGNVVLLPQPLPGLGEDTFKLVHGTQQPPPWPYIASYLWTRNIFKADAILHFGTHGSLEFTPYKQVGLSDRDWPDALIGDMPHVYLYTMSNVGEAMIAKRRSYATIISHLTPPFSESGAQSPHRKLADQLQSWDQAASPALKTEYARDVQRETVMLGLHRDLGLDEKTPWTDAQLQRVAEHMETLEHGTITMGLYALGAPYADADLRASADLMGRDALMQALAELDMARGLATRSQLDSARWVAQRYRPQADRLMALVADASPLPSAQVLASIVTPKELAHALPWEARQRRPGDDALVRNLISLGNAAAAGRSAADTAENPAQDAGLQRSLERVLSDPEKKDFLSRLDSDQAFRQASRTLDPESLEAARRVAQATPSMAKALDIATDPDMKTLLTAMQVPEVRKHVLAWLKDPALQERARQQAARQAEQAHQELIERAGAELPTLERTDAEDLARRIQGFDDDTLKDTQDAIQFWRKADGLPPAFQAQLDAAMPKLAAMRRVVEQEKERRTESERRFAQAVLTLRDRLAAIPGYRQSLAGSPAREFAALDTALSGGYVQPSSGGDPISNPAALPTGRNLYSIDAEKTPSEQAWRIGRQLADRMLTRYRDDHGGAWPEKVALTLWAGDFIQNEGVGFAQILSLLGVEPVRDPFGRVSGLRLMPRETLGRPRIDVVVQTSGQLRDLAASRLYLVNRAVAMAAAAREDDNAVAAGVGKVERALKERGLSPADARRYASLRVFGGVNGNYGTHIMGMVEAGDRWQNDTEVAQTYLNNMGAVYGEGDLWGAFQPGVFEAALTGADLVIQPLQSNTWGPISLDHVYEFMGGLNLAVRQATGKDPAAYFSDLRNPARPTMREAGETIALEARSTLLNPAHIQAMTQGGASSAEVFAETFRNVYGWNVMKPAAIAPQLWDALYDTYVRDTSALGLQDFFERTNPYALQEMTAVMLETARKGYWKPDAQVLRDTARLHADLVTRHGASGTGFVNDNAALRAFIAERLDKGVLPRYEDALQQANEGGVIDTANGLVLRKQEDPAAARPSAGQPGAEPVQEPARQPEPEAVSPAYRYAAPVGALLALLAALAGVILWIRRRHAAQEFHA